MGAYGERTAPHSYEYDHFVPLELGGAVTTHATSGRSRTTGTPHGFYLNPKDKLETAMKHLVCAHRLTLAEAERQMAANWVAAMRRYG